MYGIIGADKFYKLSGEGAALFSEKEVAPRAGFEPATNRLTAGCSTAELPGNSALVYSELAYSKSILVLPSPFMLFYQVFSGKFLKMAILGFCNMLQG